MGTVFSFDLRDVGDWTAALEAATSWLHQVDATYSTYREESVVSRLARGELTLAECDAEVREVFDRCDAVARQSHGFFSVTPGGRLDPSGLVKGWAIERASDILRAHGSANHAVNGGGDMQLAGGGSPGAPWRVGISDPRQVGQLLTVVVARDAAVATSGTAERGAHVFNPFSQQPATELASVTVVGSKLTLVDAYATAALAMGEGSREWVESLAGFEAMAVRPDGTRWQTTGFAAWVG